MLQNELKPIALTMGEPASIAPEITLKAWLSLRSEASASFLFIGDARLLADTAKALGQSIPIKQVAAASKALSVFAQSLPVLDLPLAKANIPGEPDPANAPAVEGAIRRAAELALRHETDAIVTNPVQKASLYRAGFAYQGHTDFLGALAKPTQTEPVMMLAAKDVRTVPVTVHVPLKDVVSRLSEDLIVRQTRTVAHDLTRYFGITHPRIAVSGLNPHAGEDGMIGEEEMTIIAPAVSRLRKEGFAVFGPYPADTLFLPETRPQYDAVICMYHDQALIPVKTLGFHDGVNITLGLPFIRTSPDHGTALQLAGKGKADPASLIRAIRIARSMADCSQVRR